MVNISKPSWDTAPSWARWLAQQHDGAWYWFYKKPSIGDVEGTGEGWSGTVGLHASPNENWQETLEGRP